LGHELHLYLNSGKNNFVATVDTRLDVDVGNTIDLELDMKNMHLFDKNTEQAIR
jgi:multiple sugar transport system ATP-binding protein